MGAGASFLFGTIEAPAAQARGPPSLWDPAAWVRGPLPIWDHRRGPPSHWDHRGPRRIGVGPPFALGPPRPPPHGRGGLSRFGTTEAPAAWAQGPPPFWDHRGPRHMGAGASFLFGTTEAPAAWARGPPPLWDHRGPRRVGEGASSSCTVGGGAKPSPVTVRVPWLAASPTRWLSIHTRAQVRSRWDRRLGRVCLGPRTDTSGRSALRWGGGGDLATDQAPVTCWPNAAQSVVLGGLRAHTRETASLFPRGGGGLCRKWSRRSASPPQSVPLGGSSSV